MPVRKKSFCAGLICTHNAAQYFPYGFKMGGRLGRPRQLCSCYFDVYSETCPIVDYSDLVELAIQNTQDLIAQTVRRMSPSWLRQGNPNNNDSRKSYRLNHSFYNPLFCTSEHHTFTRPVITKDDNRSMFYFHLN